MAPPTTATGNQSSDVLFTISKKQSYIIAGCCFLTVPLVLILTMYVEQLQPSFHVESVSVSLSDFPDDPSQLQADWNIGFHVDFFKTNSRFDVSVNCMTRNSTTSLLSGSGHGWWRTHRILMFPSHGSRFNATVSSQVPRFNTTNAGLDLDVNFLTNGNKRRKFYDSCISLKVGFLANENEGHLVGGVVNCYRVWILKTGEKLFDYVD